MVDIPRVIIPPLEPGTPENGSGLPVPTSRPSSGAVGVLWAPFSHQHAIADVTGLQAALDGIASSWDDITGKPSTFPPDAHTHPQSEVTGLVAALALLAPLASPALTGTPTAPTAAPGTATTQIATTDFVNAGLNTKLDSVSPSVTGGLYLDGGTTSEPSLNIFAGVAPSSPTNGDVWQTSNLLHMRLNGVSQTFAMLGLAQTFTAKQTFPATTTGAASINLPHGTAPTSPADGDLWTTTAGFYVRINGATVGPLGTGGGGGLTDAPSDGAMYARMDAAWQEAVPNLAGSYTLNGRYVLPASTTSLSSLRITPGVAPTSPGNGDFWVTTTNLHVRVNGTTQNLASEAYVTTQLGSYLTTAAAATTYAPLASPALTGNPTAPTQSAGNNSTRIATTAYVDTGLGLKANLASPTFTGKVTTAASATGGAGFNLPHGTAPTSPVNGDLWTTTTGLVARINGTSVTLANATHTHAQSDVTNLTTDLAARVLDTGDTMTGQLVLPAATTSLSPLRIPHGTAHSSPTNGDIWTTTTGLHARINGATITFANATHTHAQSDVTNLTTDLAARVLDTGDTMTGQLVLPAATTSLSPLRIPHGTAHSSPTNGDIWTTTTGLHARINGATVTFANATHTHAQSDVTNLTTDLAARVLDTGDTMTGQLILPAATTSLSPLRIPHGTAHSSPTNGDIWTTTAGVQARIDGGTFTLAGLERANGWSAKQTFVAASTSIASITLPHGTAPTSPSNGDMWTTTAGLYVRINGTTVGPLGAGGGGGTHTNSGTAPSTPAQGDTWFDTDDGILYTRVSDGVTEVWVESGGSIVASGLQLTGGTMTGQLVLKASDTTSAPLNLPSGSAPTTPANGDIWAVGAAISYRDGGTTYTLARRDANTFVDKQTLFTSTTAKAGLNIPHGVAPTSPVNGDIWTETTGLYARINGSTEQMASLAASNVFAQQQFFKASTTGSASMRISHGTAPTSPADGDFWSTTSGLFMRVNGTTRQFAQYTGNTDKIVAVTSGTGGASINLPPGSADPTSPVNGDVWIVNGQFRYRTSLGTGTVAVYDQQQTWTAKPTFRATDTSNASIQIPHGTAPTSPSNGDLWTTTSGLFVRINGATSQFLDTANAAATYAALSGANFTGNVQAPSTSRTRQAVTASATTNIDRANGDVVELTMSANITTLNISNWPASGRSGQLHLKLDFTGAFTITWPAAVRWPGGTAPTLTGVNAKTDHIMLQTEDGGTTIYGFVMGQNYTT